MITRRHILATTLLLATALATPARAEDKPAEIRIGTQKGGFFPAVRQRQTLESAFKPLGIEIKWIDFQFGPPQLEPSNVGSRRLTAQASRRAWRSSSWRERPVRKRGSQCQ